MSRGLATVNIALLRTFLVCYRAGSMTGAAAELGVSQPGVTAQVRSLEQQLGVELFRRSRRGLHPTTAADELAHRVGPHLDGLMGAITDSDGRPMPGPESGADPFRRTVLLGGPPELTGARVLPALSDLYDRGLRLRVSTGLADDLLAELAAGGLDLVVSTIRPRVRRVTAVPLTDEEFQLVASPETAGRLDGDRLAVEPAAVLADERVVAYDEQLPIIRRYWRHVFGRPAPRRAAAVLVADLRAVAAAVAAGAGYSVLPAYLVRDDVEAGRLVVLYDAPDSPINTFHLAWRTAATGHPAVAAVRTQLRMNAPLW
ncbi:MAG: LysR family transcriptional regulator [Dermatophilaceae bacterium]